MRATKPAHVVMRGMRLDQQTFGKVQPQGGRFLGKPPRPGHPRHAVDVAPPPPTHGFFFVPVFF